MVFSSYKFIFGFLPIVWIVWAILKKFKSTTLIKLWLVVASCVFYAWGQPRFLPVFLIALISNYAFVYAIDKLKSRALRIIFLLLGIFEGIGVLFYFKYLNFTLYSFNRFLGCDFTLTEIFLPLGISFYTFQIMTYLIDVFKKEAPVYPLLDYLTYVTFFPQLVVGPIVRHRELLPQLTSENLLKSDGKETSLGILLFSIGCAKKVLIADPLINFALTYYGQEGGDITHAWLATLAYTFAYYFDFSGYGDMALGLGRFFNIRLPFNFNSPYKSRNMAEFWRRWNITVSSFFDDYVFRSIFRFGDRRVKLVFATIVTFAVSGIWHGAGWNYILWGLVNGVLVAIVNLATVSRIRLPSFIAYPLTAICIIFTRVLFDSSSFTEIKKTLGLMLSFDTFSLSSTLDFIYDNAQAVVLIAVGAVICYFFKSTKEIADSYKPSYKWAIFSALLFCLALFNMSQVSRFLYFNF
ncbi:MAG: MBOAT family protein [Clostridia bacterium]|nr:MBOAT family protein [Clostridia bacterium]